MTTIIVTILTALGIGSGIVMSANNGSSASSGTAVVSPVNPGGGGGGGGSDPYNPNYKIIPNTRNAINFQGNTNIKPEGILNDKKPSTILVSKISNAKLSDGKFNMSINPFAPIKTDQEGIYTTNELFAPVGNIFVTSGYEPGQPSIFVDFDLTLIKNTANKVDSYNNISGLNLQIPTLKFSYVSTDSIQNLGTFNNVEWELLSAQLNLGGRLLQLKSSDFGYIDWIATYVHPDIDENRATKNATQTLYIFDKDRQLLKQNYFARYTDNKATFKGNVVGMENYTSDSGVSQVKHIFGDINLSFDFNTRELKGSFSNMKYDDIYNYFLNSNFAGKIYDITSAEKPNFTITAMEGNVIPLKENNAFGEGVILRSDNGNGYLDEAVGDMSFALLNEGNRVVNLSFGAINK